MAAREKVERRAAREANNRLSRGTRLEGVELFMECEEEELSPSQIAAHKRAEKEYLDAIQKINALKSANTQVIQGNQAPSALPVVSNPSPSVPETLGIGTQNQILVQGPVQQSFPQQPVQSLIGVPRVALPTSQSQQPQFIIQNTLPVPSVQPPPAAYKLLLDTRTGLILGTVPNDGQTLIATTGTTSMSGSQNPLSIDRMHILYGQPRRTSNKAHAVKLFENGKDVRAIAKAMHISESAAELYLIDSIYLGLDVNYMRLSRLLSISGNMIDRILDLLTTHQHITLSELQQETANSYNQIRLCIARLFRGFFWQVEEDLNPSA